MARIFRFSSRSLGQLILWMRDFQLGLSPLTRWFKCDQGQLGWGYCHAPITPAGSDEEIVEETAAGGGRVPRTRSGARSGSGAGSSTRDPEQPGWDAKLTR